MNICIVTVYNSENCGSFWQAMALKAFLENSGHHVFFLRRCTAGTTHSKRLAAARTAKRCIELDFKAAADALRQYRGFAQKIREFEVIDSIDQTIDLCIIGSDTLWNMESKYFENHRDLYWGLAIDNVPKAAYGVSVGNTPLEKLMIHPEIASALQHFAAISVRDAYTQDVIRQISGIETKVVCDPTVLIGASYFAAQAKRPCSARYLLVYYFGIIPAGLETVIRQLAREKGLQIAVMGNSMAGDIKYAWFEPDTFNDLFSAADFVVTNTYHGTLFTLL